MPNKLKGVTDERLREIESWLKPITRPVVLIADNMQDVIDSLRAAREENAEMRKRLKIVKRRKAEKRT